MGVQDLTVQMVVIVVIGVFFASFMDAIAGGGGIISVPTYLLAGLPMHFALGTNKFSSSIGTAFSTGRYIKNGYVDWKLGIPSIVLALIGSFFGTKLQLMISEVYLQYLLLIVLPVVAFVVLRQRQLPEERGDIEPKKQMAIVYLAALVVGAYDGFYVLSVTAWNIESICRITGGQRMIMCRDRLKFCLQRRSGWEKSV